jgi:hypothetical protein
MNGTRTATVSLTANETESCTRRASSGPAATRKVVVSETDVRLVGIKKRIRR